MDLVMTPIKNEEGTWYLQSRLGSFAFGPDGNNLEFKTEDEANRFANNHLDIDWYAAEEATEQEDDEEVWYPAALYT
jgi:hypothetical protein